MDVKKGLRRIAMASLDDLLQFVNRELLSVVGELRDSANARHGTIRHVSESGDVLDDDWIILCDCTNGHVHLALPEPEGWENRRVIIGKKIDSSANRMRFTPPTGHTIDGSPVLQTTAQWARRGVFSDGSDWFQILSS